MCAARKSYCVCSKAPINDGGFSDAAAACFGACSAARSTSKPACKASTAASLSLVEGELLVVPLLSVEL